MEEVLNEYSEFRKLTPSPVGRALEDLSRQKPSIVRPNDLFLDISVATKVFLLFTNSQIHK